MGMDMKLILMAIAMLMAMATEKFIVMITF